MSDSRRIASDASHTIGMEETSCLHPISKLPRALWGGFVAFCVLLLSGCLGDDEYSTSATDRLAFSTDTVALDTIISGQATNTYTFTVYNPNGKALRLASVRLEQGAASSFRVNVDGLFLEDGHAEGLEIGANDSLRVFLFANLPEQDADVPIEVTDRLIFTTEGGVAQGVVLQAWGQDVIPISTKIFETDTTLTAQRPYVITDSLVVASGATLTLAAGVRLYFHPDAHLIVHGRLLANGVQGSPVIFRGDRLGYMFSRQPYDRIPGQWGGIVFTAESYGNKLNFCDIHSGTSGLRCDSSDIETETLRLENSIVHNMSGNVLTLRHVKAFVGNCQLTNAGGDCVALQGGDNTFVHCTIANFYAFTGGRGVALSYTNYDGSSRLPLYNAAFQNCLITGYSDDEIMGSQSDRYTNDAFNYSFQNCLLGTPQVEDEGIIDCLWDNEDATDDTCREENFSPDFDLTQLIFTFNLSATSQAIDHANPDISRTYYPYDLNGRSRLADNRPDIGCYERESDSEEKPEP